MSMHPSLSTSAKNKKTRSVLKRAERLKMLLDKGTWKEGQSIFALPKIKAIRIKMVKKEKAAPAATAADTASTTETTPTTEEPTKPKT